MKNIEEPFNRHDIYTGLALFVAGIFIRLPFISRVFTDWDGPQFAIAVSHFSLKDGFPAPPGHFLYVMAARFINLFFNDPHAAMIFLSVLFSGLNCAALFLIGKRIFSAKAGLLASLIYMGSPLFWFYSITYLLYPINGFFALLTGYFIFEAICRDKEKSLIPASLFYGLMIGIRPQELMFILPLWLWVMVKVKFKYKAISLLVLGFVCLAWFIPLAMMCGGLKEYLAVIKGTLLGGSRFSDSIFNTSGLLKANLKYQLKAMALTFGIGVIPFLYYLPQFFSIKDILSDKKTQVFAAWILPVLVLWLFINFNNGGYVIVALLPMILLLGEFLNRAAQEFKENLTEKLSFFKSKDIILASFIFLLAVPNTMYYFYDFNPEGKGTENALSFVRYPDFKKREAYLAERLNYIRYNFKPEDAVVITTAANFMPVMYYLPQYRVYLIGDIHKEDVSSVLYGYLHQRKRIYNLYIPDIFKKDKVKKAVLFEDRFIYEPTNN